MSASTRRSAWRSAASEQRKLRGPHCTPSAPGACFAAAAAHSASSTPRLRSSTWRGWSCARDGVSGLLATQRRAPHQLQLVHHALGAWRQYCARGIACSDRGVEIDKQLRGPVSVGPALAVVLVSLVVVGGGGWCCCGGCCCGLCRSRCLLGVRLWRRLRLRCPDAVDERLRRSRA